MKVYWRAYQELADGTKVYIVKFISMGNHHHTKQKKEAEAFTTKHRNDLKPKLKSYYFERILRNDR